MWCRSLFRLVASAAAALQSRCYGLLSILNEKRIVCISGPITDDTACTVLLKLLSLAKNSRTKPVHLLINSPGGIVSAGLAIYDTIQSIPTPVATLCLGEAASMASLLLTAGAPSQRRALPNSRIMIHQPSGGFLGQASDKAIHAKEILKLRERFYAIYSKPVHLLINSPGETVSAGLVIYDTINSPGEIVSAGLVIYDTIQSIPIPVATLCLGQAGSMASLLTMGTLGQRRALPNSCIMIHQPFGGFLGQASDIAIHAKEILKVRDCLYAIHTKHTHQPVHRIEQFMEHNIFMSDQASDIAIHAKEILKVCDCLYAINTKHTHQPVHRIEQFMECNIFMPRSLASLTRLFSTARHKYIALHKLLKLLNPVDGLVCVLRVDGIEAVADFEDLLGMNGYVRGLT
ncbi:ATP-dependent Clp protease proteolytic subunit, mitochondrial [Ananas comosus]|uniref:ATP-dependent Clp protease proteolytic subunit n=1 Tax=Ananas comosus TaxID=4615 RepID=A0A199W7A4_ANACO|nr:ATP-dependent Clp protease proteolytic subunit, mitochondrial [Ananas comosus]